MNRLLTIRAALLGLMLALPAGALWADALHDHATAAKPSAADNRFTHGEIRKVDAAQGRLTIKHGDIKNLGMPGMTMVFKAANPQFLNVKAGDQVVFVAEMMNGVLTVTALRKEAGN